MNEEADNNMNYVILYKTHFDFHCFALFQNQLFILQDNGVYMIPRNRKNSKRWIAGQRNEC